MYSFDERRDIVIPGNGETTLIFSTAHFIKCGQKAINDHGYFAVALSGGSTPKSIYQRLALPENASQLDWKRVKIFWSDERFVPHDHPDSNYRMAMENGFKRLPIPSENIFPIPTDPDWETDAQNYEETIINNIPSQRFDLMMLGMGDDGHTASLFPKTHGLHPNDRLVIANYVPQKKDWRLTMTYNCINASSNITIYVLGLEKAAMVKTVLTGPYEPDLYPVQRVGTPSNKALWILDQDAASKLQ